MSKSKKQFQVGDQVTWTSGAAGGLATKTGTVTEVVPPGSAPITSLKGAGGPRKSESYIVTVTFPESKRKRKAKIYWPHAGVLQLVCSTTEVEAETTDEVPQ